MIHTSKESQLRKQKWQIINVNENKMEAKKQRKI
jgi:hypothetical protein